MAQQDGSGSDIYLVILRASAVFVGVVMIGLIALLLLGRFGPASQSSILGPYGVSTRLIPNAAQPADLLPDQHGVTTAGFSISRPLPRLHSTVS